MKPGAVQQNLQRSRPNHQVKDEQKAGHIAGMKSHERVYDRIGVALSFLAGLSAQDESLAEYHGLNGALHVNRAARYPVPAKKRGGRILSLGL